MFRRRTRPPDVLRDREVLEQLRDQPELLAIADAIHTTLGRDYRRRRRRGLTRTAALATVASAAAVLALVQPWSGGRGGGLVSQALAAIPGRGPIVHALLGSPVPGVELVDLRSGRSQREQVTAEFWFDPNRDVLHTLIRRDGVVVADVVASPEKTVSRAGPVLGQGSPTLDPALLAFASGYRHALASGAARPVGRALAGNGGQPILEVNTPLAREFVVLDPNTLRPRAIRTLSPTGRASTPIAHVLSLSVIPSKSSDFVAPARSAKPVASGGTVEHSVPLTLTQASRALSQPPLWAGRQLSGLQLHLFARDRLARVFSTGARARSTRPGIDLIYGAVRGGRPNWRSHFLEIQQATQPEPAYGFLSGPLQIEPLPPAGVLRLERQQPAAGGHGLWRGELKQQGLYLALTGSSRGLVIAAARSLRPIAQR